MLCVYPMSLISNSSVHLRMEIEIVEGYDEFEEAVSSLPPKPRVEVPRRTLTLCRREQPRGIHALNFCFRSNPMPQIHNVGRIIFHRIQNLGSLLDHILRICFHDFGCKISLKYHGSGVLLANCGYVSTVM